MKNFDRMFAGVVLLLAVLFLGVNLYLWYGGNSTDGRQYRVEINRIALAIKHIGLEGVDLSEYDYVTGVEKYYSGDPEFWEADSDYSVREIGGELYRFDYKTSVKVASAEQFLFVNLALGLMSLLLLSVMLFLRQELLRPFQRMLSVPYELSRGNLSVPIKESKNRFFGKFLWGVDMLRENIEQQRERELTLQKEKKTLLLSLSHDIKTPLSAIKLYAKAISKELYPEREQQIKIAESINAKADEIERFVSEIIGASREDFLELEVTAGEFYLSELIGNISGYYREKLSLIKTEFVVEEYADCLLKGDFDRSVEVLQNLMENAIKYGDGRQIAISFSKEEDCRLVCIQNSGCALLEGELLHIFESFWRGSNVGNSGGTGLGLSICRQLMHKMNGDIFAEVKEGRFCITVVFGEV